VETLRDDYKLTLNGPDPIDDFLGIHFSHQDNGELRMSQTGLIDAVDKLLPLPQPPVRARTDARTNPSAQRANQLRSVLARVYAVSIQNQITTTVP
jgi:hypothetical protein